MTHGGRALSPHAEQVVREGGADVGGPGVALGRSAGCA